MIETPLSNRHHDWGRGHQSDQRSEFKKLIEIDFFFKKRLKCKKIEKKLMGIFFWASIRFRIEIWASIKAQFVRSTIMMVWLWWFNPIIDRHSASPSHHAGLCSWSMTMSWFNPIIDSIRLISLSPNKEMIPKNRRSRASDHLTLIK